MKNISSELSSVSDWYGLGINLGLEPAQLSDCGIKEGAPTEIEHCKKVLELWLPRPDASWKNIVKALEDVDGEMATARWIERKYITETGVCVSVCVCMWGWGGGGGGGGSWYMV